MPYIQREAWRKSAEKSYLITYDLTFCLAWRTRIMRIFHLSVS